MKTCPKCELENVEASYTCSHCGTELQSFGYEMESLDYADQHSNKSLLICAVLIAVIAAVTKLVQ